MFDQWLNYREKGMGTLVVLEIELQKAMRGLFHCVPQ